MCATYAPTVGSPTLSSDVFAQAPSKSNVVGGEWLTEGFTVALNEDC